MGWRRIRWVRSGWFVPACNFKLMSQVGFYYGSEKYFSDLLVTKC